MGLTVGISGFKDIQMSRKKRNKRKLSGHYCWACDRRRPNEKFSGRGHSRHLCRECAKLGAEELAYRQALRNLQQCITWGGFIRRKRRKTFEQFLHHENPRIRALAEEIQEEEHARRRRMRVEAEIAEITSGYWCAGSLDEMRSEAEFDETAGESFDETDLIELPF